MMNVSVRNAPAQVLLFLVVADFTFLAAEDFFLDEEALAAAVLGFLVLALFGILGQLLGWKDV